jgi:hypothetical protein
VGKTITFGELERKIGVKIGAWNKVLDPIYEDCRTQGHPDLTVIIIYKETGYPPFFSDGGEARSKRFNPNDLRQGTRHRHHDARRHRGGLGLSIDRDDAPEETGELIG